MKAEPLRNRALLAALMILLAIVAIPFVLLGIFGGAQGRHR